jgi:hypothetical protein
VPGVNLPPVNVPGLTAPGVPLPNLPAPGLPASGQSNNGSQGQSAGSYLDYKPAGETVAQKVMPKGYGSGSGASSQYVAPGLEGGSLNAPSIPFKAGNGSTSRPATAAGKAKAAPSSVDASSNSSHSAITGLPALLVVLAVIALSAATAFYARTFLLHRPLLAKIAAKK